MPVIAGLWNPEFKYHATRHNVGAEVIDTLARRWDIPLKKGPLRVRANVGRLTVAGSPVVLALPLASMNVAGGAVQTVMRYFKEDPAELLVVHDDIDLPFGRMRLQFGRGSGGHNGVKSVAGVLGTNEFHRLKMGIGRPPGTMDPAAFVLRPFSKSERPEVDLMLDDAADVVEKWLREPEAAVQLAGERRPPS